MPRKILFANENEIVYEPYKSSLDLAWDSLATYYQQKAIEYQSDRVSKQALFTKFQIAKVELETISTTYKLIKEEVLSCVNVHHKVENKVNLFLKIVSDSKKIIEKKLAILRDSINKERKLLQIVQEYDCTIEHGVLKIILDNTHYVVIDGERYIYPDKWKPTGLRCTIEYKGLRYSGTRQCKGDLEELEQIIEYVQEKKLIGEYISENIKISIDICENETGGNNLCLLILDKFRRNSDINVIYEIVICYMCKIYWKNLVDNEYQVVNSYDNKMIDGLSKEYFVIAKIGVIRVSRGDNDFLIYLNENEIRTSTDIIND